jgi:hypothetical protein
MFTIHCTKKQSTRGLLSGYPYSLQLFQSHTVMPSTDNVLLFYSHKFWSHNYSFQTNSGILLGVMGTDVPLKELTKLTPKYKVYIGCMCVHVLMKQHTSWLCMYMICQKNINVESAYGMLIRLHNNATARNRNA